MADIELVIRISKEDFEIMKHNIAVNNPLCPLSQEEMISKVANGTPIPQGHGRIIDENKITKCEQVGLIIKDENTTRCLVTDAPTIIEADKS